MSTRVNMAAVAARMAADEASYPEIKGLVYDAGELRSRDLVADSSTLVTDPLGADGSPLSPSKTQQRLWDAKRIDASQQHSPAKSTSKEHGKLAEAKRKMLALRASVVDALDVLSAQREDARFRIGMLRDNTSRNNADTLATIKTFDNEYTHIDAIGHTVPVIMEEACTELRMPYLERFGLPVRVPSEETINARFAQANGKLLSDQEGAQLCHSIRKEITGLLFPFDDRQLPELICSVNRFTRTDVVKMVVEALAKHDGALASMDASIAELEERIAQFMLKEDFGEAERLTAKLLELSGKRTDINAVKLVLLAGDDTDQHEASVRSTASSSAGSRLPTGAGFVKALDQLLYGSAVPDLKEEKKTLIGTCRSDLTRLGARHVTVLRDNETATARYGLAVQASREQINANHAQQRDIWEKVLVLMNELEGVGLEHEALVAAHTKATEAEQLRRQDHREYMDSYRRHTVCLEELIRNSETAVTFLDTLSARFHAARAEVESSGVEDRLQTLLTQQRKEYLDAFSHFGSGSNRHVARYDQRIANCEHMLQALEFAHQQAPTVGDADKNAYARRANELDRQRRAAADKLDDFAGAYQVREDTFADIAARVQAAQRSRATKLRAGVAADSMDDSSVEGELLSSLRQTRAAAVQSHFDRLSVVAQQNKASADTIRQRRSEAEGRALQSEAALRQKQQSPSPTGDATQAQEVQSGYAPTAHVDHP